MLRQRLHVLGVGLPREQAGVDARIQSLDATIEHLGKTGVLRNFGDFNTACSKHLCGASGRKNSESERA